MALHAGNALATLLLEAQNIRSASLRREDYSAAVKRFERADMRDYYLLTAEQAAALACNNAGMEYMILPVTLLLEKDSFALAAWVMKYKF